MCGNSAGLSVRTNTIVTSRVTPRLHQIADYTHTSSFLLLLPCTHRLLLSRLSSLHVKDTQVEQAAVCSVQLSLWRFLLDSTPATTVHTECIGQH